MDEVNPMAEMGFMHDKQLIVEAQGFLTPANSTRNLAVQCLKDGGKIYDLLDRYGKIVAYVLNRDDVNNNTDTLKLLAPFLKAFDTTDYEVKKFYDSHMPILPGAKEAMQYFLNTMPTFIDSRMYEHAVDSLCEQLDIPSDIANSTQLDLDGTNMSRQTCREVRGLAADITRLKISKKEYELNAPTELDEVELKMISTLDDVFLKKFHDTECADMIQNMNSVGPNEKSYTLLDIRKNTQVDLDGTVYIGGDLVDFPVMDLIKEGNGLALSFNGGEFAVHGSNIAVLSEDCLVAAVLVAKFYDTGIQGVFDLVDNWNREYLENVDFPDRNLLDEMLRRNPKTLPEVIHVTRSNVGEVAAKSDAFREKLFKKYALKSPTE